MSTNLFEGTNNGLGNADDLGIVEDSLDDKMDDFIQQLANDSEESEKIEFSEDDFDEDYEEDVEAASTLQKLNKNDGDSSPLISSDEDYDGIPIEDDYNDSYNFKDALRSAGNFRVRNKKSVKESDWKRKMNRSNNRELPPEVRHNLSQANEAFVRSDFLSALTLYREVIKKDPKNFNAYKTLGEIYKQQGKLNECCNYWLLAANIHPWDSQFWGNVAELSAELKHIDQAIYCYTRAISSDILKSSTYILQRSVLYREKKQFGRALEGFQKVRQFFPTDSGIIKNIASVYVEQKRINDAINLYMSILDYNIKGDEGKYPKFGWAELNILLELYIQQHSWRVGIRVIRLVSRWIQDRTKEIWWDLTDDDSEFDEKRRFEILEKMEHVGTKEDITGSKEKFYDLPIDIRYKIGHLRLGLGQKHEAMHHLKFLLNETEDVADLYFDTGKILEENGYHEDAMNFLARAAESLEFQDNPDLINLLGKCFLEIGDYSQAKQAYEALLFNEPGNLDHKIALAEALHHLGDAKGARKLLLEVATERESKKDLEDIDSDVDSEEIRNENLSLIKSNDKIIKSNKLTDQEKVELENNAKRKVLEKYRRMNRLDEAIIEGDRNAIKAWMQLASQLIEMFMNVRSFFPRDKNRTFKGIVLYRRKKQMGIDEKLARVYNLYEGIVTDESYSRHFLTSKTEYRGLSYDIWFNIFVQYAMLLTNYDDNIDYANEIIEVAMTVSIFLQDKQKESFLKLIKLLFSIKQNDHESITTYIRSFLITNQMSPFVYKFFMCCFSLGIKSWEYFTSYNHQKFFLRHLKAYDSVISNKKITGMATITANFGSFEKISREHPDLIYIYSNLLGGSRSYVSSVVYLNRAYKEYNQDPMICFTLGLSHVHRSMQRLSNNRHIQLLQGISYILEYRELRLKNATVYEKQEVEYNFGRLFHTLGLTSLAVTHYNRVLEFEIGDDYDLLMEAAFNLTLIYNVNGNSRLAREITERYLTV